MVAQRQIAKQRLFGNSALMPERVELQGAEACAARLETLLQHAREGEVHVVAAEQNVVAHRDYVRARGSRRHPSP
jgi:2-oxoglutarate dehydrogenase complex dehydrogenase (E1) component-like enzyme